MYLSASLSRRLLTLLSISTSSKYFATASFSSPLLSSMLATALGPLECSSLCFSKHKFYIRFSTAILCMYDPSVEGFRENTFEISTFLQNFNTEVLQVLLKLAKLESTYKTWTLTSTCSFVYSSISLVIKSAIISIESPLTNNDSGFECESVVMISSIYVWTIMGLNCCLIVISNCSIKCFLLNSVCYYAFSNNLNIVSRGTSLSKISYYF